MAGVDQSDGRSGPVCWQEWTSLMAGVDQSDDRRGQRTRLTEPNRTDMFPPVSKSVNIPKVP